MEEKKPMSKASYVNATQIYEWPLRCFQPPKFDNKRLRNCSLDYVHRLAAGVVADELAWASLYARPVNQRHTSIFAEGSHTSRSVLTGTLCLLNDLDENPTHDSSGRTGLKLEGPGPCLVVPARNDEPSNKCYGEVTVCAIINRRASQSIQPRFSALTQWPGMAKQVRLPIAACSPSKPRYSFTINNGDEIMFTDEHMHPATGSLPEQYLVCYPTFSVRANALWKLPGSYTPGRQRLSEESLVRLKEIWDKCARENLTTELKRCCERVMEMQEGASITVSRWCTVL